MEENLRIFVTKAFMIPGVQKKFDSWLENNFFYCQETHSYVHRLFDEFKKCADYKEAQNKAFEVMTQMRLEFLYANYDTEELKKAVSKIEYETPLMRLSKAINRP